MRGTHFNQYSKPAVSRFIPAYAGNTSRSALCHFRLSVHPRVCGEHPALSFRTAAGRGSSPRMRGTRLTDGFIIPSRRFIPAYAGNTFWSKLRNMIPSVHPRVCGEHLARHPIAGFGIRFIPAYAGNTRAECGNSLIASVHPRVCGEHGPGLKAASNVVGSSPRMRGTPVSGMPCTMKLRFIPAYAGNTFRDVVVVRQHPGSSPRMRGTRDPSRTKDQAPRFIPAYAGNTRSTLCRPSA